MKNYKSQPKLHEPVLKEEVVEALRVEELAHLKKGSRFIDATLGLGGNTSEILKKGGKVLGIEADPEMLEAAKEKLKEGQFKLIHGNFRDIEKIAKENGFEKVDGIVFDLGVSTPQLTSPSRGFSFQNPDAPLDMRIDRTSQVVSAADLLAVLSEKQLEKLFTVVLEKAEAKRVASEVVKRRNLRPIKKVADFLAVLESSDLTKGKLHPATRAFLALRAAVNSELENLKEALPKAFNLLAVGGRLAVISFHSGEDAIVKRFFRQCQVWGKGRIVNKKPIVPGDEQVRANPKARSAKMRVLEKR